MSKLTFDKFVEQSTAEPREIAPERDLWPGIERAIHRSEFNPKPMGYGPSLTGVAACFLAGLVAWKVVIKQPREDAMVLMSQFFEQQKQTLLVKYDAQTALVTDWQTQLQELEEAEQAIKLALKNDAENAALLKMLAQVYQQQLDLINKVYQPRWQQI